MGWLQYGTWAWGSWEKFGVEIYIAFDMILEECSSFWDRGGATEQWAPSMGYWQESKRMANCMAEEVAASVATNTWWRYSILEYLVSVSFSSFALWCVQSTVIRLAIYNEWNDPSFTPKKKTIVEEIKNFQRVIR